jgi:hypothetical protein
MKCIEVKGRHVFDPRVGKWIVSANPALIMADLMISEMILTPIDARQSNIAFWDCIGELADFCDTQIGVIK